MNPQLIQNALVELIKPTAEYYSLTPHLPGYEYERVTTPGIIIDFTPIDRPNVTLKGGEITREEGQFTVAVVVEQGQGTSTAYARAHNIATALNEAAYNGGAKLNADNDLVAEWWDFFFAGVDVNIQLSKPADVRPGYPDGSNWRVPVVASYIAGMRTA